MSKRQDIAQAALAAFSLLLIITVLASVWWLISDGELGSFLSFFAFTAVIVALGSAVNVFPRLKDIVDRGFRYGLLIALAYFAAFLPGFLFFRASQFVSESQATWLPQVFFIISGLAWFCLLALIAPTGWQRRFFRLLKNFGWLTPLIFVVNYMLVSLVFFGFLSSYLHGQSVDASHDINDHLNLFGYHLLDSIPALDVTSTLKIDEPISGERPLSLGIMILLFKAAVLLPGVSAFLAYWKSRQTKAEPA